MFLDSATSADVTMDAHALQLETIPAEYLPNADLDGDGRITIADAIIALRLTLAFSRSEL